MISYEFTADEASSHIIQVHKGDVSDYLEVPLRIRIPHHLAIEYGLDQLQTQITAAMEGVVKTLNHKIS